MHKCSRLFIVVFFFLSKTFFGQVYDFNLYTEDNGLAQNYIYSISQSTDGFIYLSTGNGFVVYEGNKFKTYTTNDNHTTVSFDTQDVPAGVYNVTVKTSASTQTQRLIIVE